MSRYIETDLKEVKEQLTWNIRHGHKTVLLLGSGVSVSAGIPASEGIIDSIRTSFSAVCARTHPVTYEDHLSVLTAAQRHELIRNYAANSKLNTAHLYVAALVKAGYCDTILTTNFDTLLHRALALENIYPNIYDFTGANNPESANFSDVSLYHLHGQKDGMLYLRNEESFDNYLDKMEKFFGGMFEERTIIVIGYSGSDDPVFSYLAGIKSFSNRMYWVGHNEKEPEEHVYRSLLQKTNKQVCYVKGYDADTFFTGLNQELGVAEPRILSNPMSLVQEVMGEIAVNAESSYVETPLPPVEKQKIQENAEPTITQRLETTEEAMVVADLKERNTQALQSDLVSAGTRRKIDDDELLRLAKDTWSGRIHKNYHTLAKLISHTTHEDARKYFSLFLFNWGTELEKEADQLSGDEADHAYKKAFEKYEEALKIKPDLKEAYNQWGVCLREMAKSKEGPLADKLFEEAFKKFEEAILISPSEHETLNNWAAGLAQMAQTKNEVEAEKLYFQAFEKYKEALQLKPDLHEVYNNWGVCLKNLASLKSGEEAEKLFNSACQKFKEAIELSPDFTVANINWGHALREQAKHAESADAIDLHQQAIDKYINALKHNPESADAFNNWGIELGLMARHKGVKEASKLLTESFSKYEESVLSNPSCYQAYNNWAVDIWNYGNLNGGHDAKTLYNEALEKFDLALSIQPDSAEILTNKAICLYKISELDQHRKTRFAEAISCFSKATDLKPGLFEAYYQCGIAYRNQAEKFPSEKSEDMFIQSLKQFEKAMKHKPEKYKLNLYWDNSITNLAEYLYEDEPEKLYQSTFRRYQESIYTEQSSLEFYNSYDVNLTKMGKTPPEEEYEKLVAETIGEM